MAAIEDITLTVVFTILVTCSLLGNIMVIVVVIRNPLMRKPINFLIANLAASDVLFSTFLIPRFILIHAFNHPHGISGDYLCKFITGGNLTWTGGAASVFTLVAIAMERYNAIVFPCLAKRRFTHSKAKLTAVLSWLGSLILNLPLFFVSVYNSDQDFCVESWSNVDISKVYSMVWFITVGAIPFSFMTYSYIRVMYNLWGPQTKTAPITQQVLYQCRKKVTKIVLLVTFVYSITWFPALAYYAFVAYIGDHYGLGSIIHRINQVLTAVNATSNPCIYAFQSQMFRRSVGICGRRTRRSNAVEPIALHTLSPSIRTREMRRLTII